MLGMLLGLRALARACPHCGKRIRGSDRRKLKHLRRYLGAA